MNLVTTCTRCGTNFRVVADQLKLRGGRVRCGVCQEVFCGLEHLRGLDETVDPAGEETGEENNERMDEEGGAEDYAPERSDIDPSPGSNDGNPGAHALRARPKFTVYPVDQEPRSAAREASETSTLDPDDLASDRTDEAGDPSRGAFDQFGEAAKRTGEVHEQAGLRWRLPGDRGTGPQRLLAVVLLAALALQTIVAGRDWLAARFPALEPMVAAATAPFGLEIELPRSLETLSIESFELQSSSQSGLLSASAILRNGADYPVRWPSMDLTLTDSAERILARRIVDPEDYIGQRSEPPLRGRSERKIRFALQTDGFEPSGYSVLLFYR